MKTKTLPSLGLALALVAGVFISSAAFAADSREHDKKSPPAASGQLTPVDAKTDAAWLAKAIAAYPVDRCVVSGDKFDGGAMGKAQNFVYKTAGKPDRLVRFCCDDCVKDFNENPAKFLKAIDDAAAAKAKAGK